MSGLQAGMANAAGGGSAGSSLQPNSNGGRRLSYKMARSPSLEILAEDAARLKAPAAAPQGMGGRVMTFFGRQMKRVRELATGPSAPTLSGSKTHVLRARRRSARAVATFFLQAGSRTKMAAGEVLIEAGKPSSSLYLVVSGSFVRLKPGSVGARPGP